MKTNWPIGIAVGACVITVVLSVTDTGPLMAQGNGAITLNCDNQPCDDVARGRAAFKDRNLRQLGGNGRACADCHVPSDSFQLSPSVARARFEALSARRARNRNADDPGRRSRIRDGGRPARLAGVPSKALARLRLRPASM